MQIISAVERKHPYLRDKYRLENLPEEGRDNSMCRQIALTPIFKKVKEFQRKVSTFAI